MQKRGKHKRSKTAQSLELSFPLPEIIKRMRADGRTIGAIANSLSLPQDTIRRIVYGDEYKDKIRIFPSGKLPAIISAEPTQQLFLRWLAEAVARLSALPAWPMGAGQFTYFKSIACWDWSGARLHTVDLREFDNETAHRSGDREAIFKFAKGNRDALRHSWVIDQFRRVAYSGDTSSKE